MKFRIIDTLNTVLSIAWLGVLVTACEPKVPLNFEIPKSLLDLAMRSPPSVYWDQRLVTVSEGAGSVSLVLRLTAPSPLQIKVPILPNSAIPGYSGTTATFAPGSTEARVSIPIRQNTEIESSLSRSANLVIGLPDYANQGTPGSLELSIVDDDRPVIGFSILDQNVSESSGAITLTAESDRPVGGTTPLKVTFDVGGSAATGTDFTLGATSFSFEPGSKSASVTLDPIKNSSETPLKNVTLKLTRADSDKYALNPTRLSSQVVIRDDDGALRVGFSPMVGATIEGSTLKISVSEAAGTIQVPVLLNRSNPTSVSLPVTVGPKPSAISGVDFMLYQKQVTIQAGATRGEVSFKVVDNLNYKGSRSFALVLGTPNEGATLLGFTQLLVTINDNESPPTFQFENLQVSRSEGSGIIDIPVSLSGLSAVGITAKATLGSSLGTRDANGVLTGESLLGEAIAGVDFNRTRDTVTIPAGFTRGNFQITAIDDTSNEDPEDMIAVLTAGASVDSRGLNRTVVTLIDNDPSPRVQWSVASQTIDESGGKALVVAKLEPDQAAGKIIHIPFGVSGSAQLGVHHNLTPSEIIIPKGSNQATLEVPLVRDSNSEPNQNLILTLQDGGNVLVGTLATHTIQITDLSGFIPSITAFQNTVWTYVRGQACYSCHKPGGSAGALAPFASDNLQDAFNAAVARTNFTNIPSSLLVSKLQTPTHQTLASLTPDLITQITNWMNQSGGSGGGSPGGPSSSSGSGSLGIQDFQAIEATLSAATQIAIPAVPSGTYPTLRDNTSADGDPIGFSAPMAGAYIGLAAYYCKEMVNDIGKSGAPKRGFDQITGLNNFSVSVAGFTPPMQDQVTQRLAELFWQRSATPEELTEMRLMVAEILAPDPSPNPTPTPSPAPPAITVKSLAIGICTAIGGSVETFDN